MTRPVLSRFLEKTIDNLPKGLPKGPPESPSETIERIKSRHYECFIEDHESLP